MTWGSEKIANNAGMSLSSRCRNCVRRVVRLGSRSPQFTSPLRNRAGPTGQASQEAHLADVVALVKTEKRELLADRSRLRTRFGKLLRAHLAQRAEQEFLGLGQGAAYPRERNRR